MRTKNLIVTVICCLGLAMAAGCSKKVTKIAEQSPPPKTVPQVQPPQEQPRVEERVNINDVLVPIYFDFDRYALRSSEIPKLERIAAALSRAGNVRLVCEGHCDERGSHEYNMGLGENRARAVKLWLTAYGIPDRNLETTSYGKERPVALNCADEYCHERNRRVEWRVIGQ